MRIERRFVRVGQRQVHYRLSGEGPPVVLIHQNPKNSAEMVPFMRELASRFTCIAPDTAGLGQSDPLPNPVDIQDIGQSLIDFLDALGLEKVGAYGFHSGSVQLMQALTMAPDRFYAVAMGGYGLWTAEEQARFDDQFVAPFYPQAFGEHLAWLWRRLIEQGWFFPWHEANQQHRLAGWPVDADMLDNMAMEWLEAGDNYRQAFGSSLRAKRALPLEQSELPPVLISAYPTDPLHTHLERIEKLPTAWEVETVTSAEQQHQASADFLEKYAVMHSDPLTTSPDAGFVHIDADGFDGLIHWAGDRDAESILLHAPGASMRQLPKKGLRIDLPGHGLSDPFESCKFNDWSQIVAQAVLKLFGDRSVNIVGYGASALLAIGVARLLDCATACADDALIPIQTDMSKWQTALPALAADLHGSHLHQAWSVARASACFWPWFEPVAANQFPLKENSLSPDQLTIVHLDLLRARKAHPALWAALSGVDRTSLLASAKIGSWSVPIWAEGRNNIWHP